MSLLASSLDSARDSVAHSVDFKVYDQLGDDQVSERVSLIIDGRVVGMLNVNKQFPQTMVTVTVPNAGMHSFTVDAVGTFMIEGHPDHLTGVGQGSFDIEPGDEFHLAGSTSGRTWLVGLVKNGKQDSTLTTNAR